MRVLGLVVTTNNWRLVLRLSAGGELSEFLRLMTVSRTQRRNANRHMVGTRPLYQDRFKRFPIERDKHLLTVSRHVDRGSLERAEQWSWGGLSLARFKDPRGWLIPPRRSPVTPPADWLGLVNTPQTVKQEAAVQTSIRRGRPFGAEEWVAKAARSMGLESTLRPRGRRSKRPV